MGYVDTAENRRYQKEYSAQKYKKNKAEIIEYLGGCCVRCNSTQDLEFDHIDPSTKKYQIARLILRLHSPRSRQMIWEEIDKCQLLCNTCHTLKTVQEVRLHVVPGCTLDHGSHRGYKTNGCRCSLCMEYNKLYNARRREYRNLGIWKMR